MPVGHITEYVECEGEQLPVWHMTTCAGGDCGRSDCMDIDLAQAIARNTDGDAEMAYAAVTAVSAAAETHSVRTRYARPGQRAGSGYVRKLTDRQVRYIMGLMAERDTTDLVRLPGSENVENMSLRGARDLIDRLLACPKKRTYVRPATPKMISYARSLIASRIVPDDMIVPGPDDPWTPGFTETGHLITMLKEQPWRPREVASGTVPAQGVSRATIGFYRLDGRYYVVRPTRDGQRLYALEVCEHAGGKSMFLEYRAGVVNRLTQAHRVSAEVAEELSARYGQCVVCSRELTAEESVKRSIGPICYAKYF